VTVSAIMEGMRMRLHDLANVVVGEHDAVALANYGLAAGQVAASAAGWEAKLERERKGVELRCRDAYMAPAESGGLGMNKTTAAERVRTNPEYLAYLAERDLAAEMKENARTLSRYFNLHALTRVSAVAEVVHV
jgi:hypothetical protein